MTVKRRVLAVTMVAGVLCTGVMAAAANARPDGYTIMMAYTAHSTNHLFNAKIPYDPIADFIPVSLVAVSEYALTVHPSLPARSVKDLIALAKSRPQQIAFGSTGITGGPHLAGEYLNNLAGNSDHAAIGTDLDGGYGREQSPCDPHAGGQCPAGPWRRGCRARDCSGSARPRG